MTTADEITVAVDRDSISATGVAAAAPAVVFDYLRRPANHQAINGDGTVKGTLEGPEVLELGSKFGMRMRLGVPYRIHSTVTAYEPDHLISWRHLGGHEWRWTLEPTDDGRSTRVTETFDMSTAKFPPALRLFGYPERHRRNVVGSVTNLIARVRADGLSRRVLGQDGCSNVWCTASTLLPSGSRTNAPKYPGWYSGHTRGSCRTSAPAATAASRNACTASRSAARNARCDSRKPSPVCWRPSQNVGKSVP